MATLHFPELIFVLFYAPKIAAYPLSQNGKWIISQEKKCHENSLVIQKKKMGVVVAGICCRNTAISTFCIHRERMSKISNISGKVSLFSTKILTETFRASSSDSFARDRERSKTRTKRTCENPKTDELSLKSKLRQRILLQGNENFFFQFCGGAKKHLRFVIRRRKKHSATKTKSPV